MRVAVVGAGVIGLGVAYELSCAGVEVVLFDRDRAGAGASSGNAGWISPALCSAPIPSPGAVAQALRWMFRPDSPFLLRPRFDRAFLNWLLGFCRACTTTRFRVGLQALSLHGGHAIADLLAWREDGVAFELHTDGLVFAALNEEALEEEHGHYLQLRETGYPVTFEVLSGSEARDLEPSLSHRVSGALWSPGEWHVRPETLTAGLINALRNQRVQIREGIRVENLSRRKAGWRLSTPAGVCDADVVVATAGAWTHTLLATHGYRLPLEAAKGYSLTGTGVGVRPRHPIYLLEAKVVCSPFDSEVRLAGTLELAGLDLTLDHVRLRALRRAGENYLRWRPADRVAEWAGLRPLTPDGLPVIGEVPGCDQLFVSTGHGMAGVTLAAASARLIRAMILGGADPRESSLLSPARYAR